ncbi:MAG: MbnP family protein [Ginsengibacter sp.]
MINFKINRTLFILICFSISFISFNDVKNDLLPASSTVKITFINTLGHSNIVLNDSMYTNPFGENYSISKLRYYVSNVKLNSSLTSFKEENSYHLIDESEEASQSFNFNIPAGNYNSLQFLLGVDSLHNVSGAQTDDLDPTKDMFWTWNTGYVMAKMEGNSPSSKLVNNKYEYHIGGYAGPYSVIKTIQLGLDKSAEFTAGKTVTIIIGADINAWWKGANDIKITDHANITSPGKLALAISDNYAKMFSIEKIISE